MDTTSPTLSMEMDLSDEKSCHSPSLPPSNSAGLGWHRSLSPENRQSFRDRLEQLLTAFEITDARRDVSMRLFLKWRVQVVWFLHRHLGGGHPYTVEFVATVEREPDPCSNGRLVIAGQAILEALLSDFDEGQIFLTTE
jgi:hypothetical protein